MCVFFFNTFRLSNLLLYPFPSFTKIQEAYQRQKKKIIIIKAITPSLFSSFICFVSFPLDLFFIILDNVSSDLFFGMEGVIASCFFLTGVMSSGTITWIPHWQHRLFYFLKNLFIYFSSSSSSLSLSLPQQQQPDWTQITDADLDAPVLCVILVEIQPKKKTFIITCTV